MTQIPNPRPLDGYGGVFSCTRRARRDPSHGAGKNRARKLVRFAANVQARSVHDRRIRGLVAAYFAFIWRSLRRLGVPDAHVDDAAQQVFVVAARKIGDVPPAGEQAFLFAVALRVAADDRRARRRRPEIASMDALLSTEDERSRPDDLLEQRQARVLLDQALEGMPLDFAPFSSSSSWKK